MGKKSPCTVVEKLEIVPLHKAEFPKCETSSRVDVSKTAVHQVDSKFKFFGKITGLKISCYPEKQMHEMII